MPSGESRHSRRRWLANGVSALGAVAFVGCERGSERPSERSLSIGIDLWAGYYPLLIASEQGWFRDAGLAVRIEIPENTNSLLANFSAMTLDAVAVALGDIINVTQRNPRVRVVMVSDQSDGGDVLVAPDEFRGKDSIRGKRIGTNVGGFGEILVRAFLERHGLRFDEVELVDVDAADVPRQLRAGAFEIGHTWEPYGAMALKDGNRLWFSSHEVRGLIPSCVAFQKRVIDERRADVRSFLETWQRAQKWWLENPEGGARLAARFRGVDPNEVNLTGVSLVGREENRRIFQERSGSDCVFDVARYYVDHFTARGMLTRPPRVQDFIDPSFMVGP